ncbi:MAG: hypothetical protein SGPRY_013998, partial [Prymnesium sp.]
MAWSALSRPPLGSGASLLLLALHAPLARSFVSPHTPLPAAPIAMLTRIEAAAPISWSRLCARRAGCGMLLDESDLTRGGWTAEEWRNEDYWSDDDEWRTGLDWNPEEDAALDTARYIGGTIAAIAFFDWISPLVNFMDGPNLNLFLFFGLFFPGLVWWVTFRPLAIFSDEEGGLDDNSFFLPFGAEV